MIEMTGYRIPIGKINELKTGYTGSAPVLIHSVDLNKELCKLSINEIAKIIAKDQKIKDGYIEFKLSFDFMSFKKNTEKD